MSEYRFEINKDTALKLQELAREEMALKLLHDIKIDVTICKFEGWDYKEYLYHLRDIIEFFLR